MGKIAVFCSIWVAFGFVFAWSDRQSIDDKGELFKKKAALLAKFNGMKRIVIAGGSNVFWGTSSSDLQKFFQMPVINISIPSEMEDPALMRELTLKLVNSGDIVVYSSMGFWMQQGVNEQRATRIAKNLNAVHYLRSRLDIKNMIDFWWQPYPKEINPATALLRNFQREIVEDPWSKNMDSHGDYLGCDDRPVKPIHFDTYTNQAKFMDEIIEFNNRLREKGVKLVSTVPWILIDPSQKSQWRSYYLDLIHKFGIKSLSLTSSDLDIVLRDDPSEFCDCAWHLKPEPGAYRTKVYMKENIARAI